MDLAGMLSGDKPATPGSPGQPASKRARTEPSAAATVLTAGSAHFPPPLRPLADDPAAVVAAAAAATEPGASHMLEHGTIAPHQQHYQRHKHDDAEVEQDRAHDAAAIAKSPYADLQHAVHAALESRTPALTTSDKVALALEVLRARQLELDLAQARNNIEALVSKSGSAPRTLRAVIPASTVRGLPVGTPVEITAGKFLLSPTTNDPQALFLTLELQAFGPPPSPGHAPTNGLAPLPREMVSPSDNDKTAQISHPTASGAPIEDPSPFTVPHGLSGANPIPNTAHPAPHDHRMHDDAFVVQEPIPGVPKQQEEAPREGNPDTTTTHGEP
jgi:hypothetical protein